MSTEANQAAIRRFREAIDAGRLEAAAAVWIHGESAWAHFRGEREGTIWYYQTAAGILGERLPSSALVSELHRQVELLSADQQP